MAFRSLASGISSAKLLPIYTPSSPTRVKASFCNFSELVLRVIEPCPTVLAYASTLDSWSDGSPKSGNAERAYKSRDEIETEIPKGQSTFFFQRKSP